MTIWIYSKQAKRGVGGPQFFYYKEIILSSFFKNIKKIIFHKNDGKLNIADSKNQISFRLTEKFWRKFKLSSPIEI